MVELIYLFNESLLYNSHWLYYNSHHSHWHYVKLYPGVFYFTLEKIDINHTYVEKCTFATVLGTKKEGYRALWNLR